MKLFIDHENCPYVTGCYTKTSLTWCCFFLPASPFSTTDPRGGAIISNPNKTSRRTCWGAVFESEVNNFHKEIQIRIALEVKSIVVIQVEMSQYPGQESLHTWFFFIGQKNLLKTEKGYKEYLKKYNVNIHNLLN